MSEFVFLPDIGRQFHLIGLVKWHRVFSVSMFFPSGGGDERQAIVTSSRRARLQPCKADRLKKKTPSPFSQKLERVRKTRSHHSRKCYSVCGESSPVMRALRHFACGPLEEDELANEQGRLG
jgi:hypothetical protein